MIFLPGDTIRVPLNLLFQLLPDYFWLLMPTGQQLEKVASVQAGVIHPGYSKDIGLLLNRRAGRGMSGNHGTRWGAS